jgi:hypothetical protein
LQSSFNTVIPIVHILACDAYPPVAVYSTVRDSFFLATAALQRKPQMK